MSLDIKNLVVRRGDFKLRADFSLERGKICVLLGPSGCGKTTLLRAIAGLEPIESGSIVLNDVHIENLPPEQRSLGFVFQDLALFERMSVGKNIGYSVAIARIPKNKQREIIKTLARRFRIEPLIDRLPSELSGGERQRVALARALARDPSLMLLDEPLSALDAPLRREMRRFMRVNLTEPDLTTIHVTHDVEEAVDLADEIIVMQDGKIVGRGTMSTFTAHPGSGWLARFMNLGLLLPLCDLRVIEKSPIIKVSTPSGTTFTIDAANDHSISAPLSARRIYVPFSALSFSDMAGHGPKILARIVRNLALASNKGKVVFDLIDIENYFFEMPIDNFKDWILSHAEGDIIELTADEQFCQLIPEDPQELTGRV